MPPQAAEATARAAADEAARLASLVGAKAARLPAEPPASSPDAVMVMVGGGAVGGGAVGGRWWSAGVRCQAAGRRVAGGEERGGG